jgi:hypothetical protein
MRGDLPERWERTRDLAQISPAYKIPVAENRHDKRDVIHACGVRLIKTCSRAASNSDIKHQMQTRSIASRPHEGKARASPGTIAEEPSPIAVIGRPRRRSGTRSRHE